MYVRMYIHIYRTHVPSILYFSLLPQHLLNNHQNNTDVPHVKIPSKMIQHTITLDGSLSEEVNAHTGGVYIHQIKLHTHTCIVGVKKGTFCYYATKILQYFVLKLYCILRIYHTKIQCHI